MPCRNGFTMYLATVIDLCLRKFAGFVIADHMRSSLVIEALDHANTVRGGLDGAIFHSDHGSVGGFNWLSQHPEHGGVRRWLPRTGVRRPVICRWG
ncbi:DDE-type integrase/transposase/recombinase, partial [Corynebacterium diphtheriae]|uniref:DDE-type integrase/transposase/recombinase n=1 Tax=Corynebacterium diphtheriae TaxID=1717 RepID=UPI0035C72636